MNRSRAGTTEFEYGSVGNSDARSSPLRPQLEKLTLGFSQWATIEATLAMGKHDGYKVQKPDSYDTLLDDARNMPVVLYDTSQHRATQTNAEDLILQVLLHRRALPQAPAHVGGASIKNHSMDAIEYAVTDRRIRTTNATMMINAERIMGRRIQLGSPGGTLVRFKDEVQRLYDTLDGLLQTSVCNRTGTSSLKIALPWARRVHGWEYMALVNSTAHRYLNPKSVDLRSSSGSWCDYLQDAEGLVLFGSNFGDIIRPTGSGSWCRACLTLPKGSDYLTVRIDAIEALHGKHGCPKDPQRLTGSGWALQLHENIFQPCGQAHYCGERRVAELVQLPPHKRMTIPQSLPSNGAIIIGRSRTADRWRWTHKVIVEERQNPF